MYFPDYKSGDSAELMDLAPTSWMSEPPTSKNLAFYQQTFPNQEVDLDPIILFSTWRRTKNTCKALPSVNTSS